MKASRINIAFEFGDGAIAKADLEGPVDKAMLHLHTKDGRTYVYSLAGALDLAKDILAIGEMAETLGLKSRDLGVDDINEALLNGTLGIGQNGVAEAPECAIASCGVIPSSCTFCAGCGELTGVEADFVRKGQRVRAVKAIRDRTGLGLKDALDTIRAWQRLFERASRGGE